MKFSKFIEHVYFLRDEEIETLIQAESVKDWKTMIRVIVPDITPEGMRLVLSDQKKFEGYPLNDVTAAKRGLHPLRAYIAYEQAKLCGADEKFLTTGIVAYENYSNDLQLGDFLPKEVANEIRQHTVNVPKNYSNILVNLDKEKYPNARYFIEDKFVFKDIVEGSPYEYDLSRMAEQKFLENTFMQNLVNEPNDGDNQKNLHLDTYFPCLKFWYFPEEVTEDGAFRYAVGSAKLDLYKLEYIYLESIKITSGDYEDWKLKDHWEGSLRISEDDLSKMGYDAKYITVPADTLVIANVNGWHGRGHTSKRVERPAIHGSIRINPLVAHV